MVGGWRRSLRDAQISVKAWEQSTNREQQESFSLRKLSFLLLLALQSDQARNNTKRSEA